MEFEIVSHAWVHRQSYSAVHRRLSLRERTPFREAKSDDVPYTIPMKNTILFPLLLCLAGCGTTPPPTPIYLGHVATTSGPHQEIGLHEVQGMRLAIENMTRAGQNLVGDRPVFVKHTDARGDLDAFEGEAVRLTSLSKVVAIYGGNTAEEVLRLDRARVPLLTPLGFRPRGASALVFATGISAASEAGAARRFAAGEKNDAASKEIPRKTYTVSTFAVDKERPKTVDFARQYREAFKEEPDAAAALAYDGVRILVDALQRAQKPGSEGLVEELRHTKDFAGLAGPLTFDSDQQLRRPVFVGRVIGGKFEADKRYD